jgi:predicted transcriptional regulator
VSVSLPGQKRPIRLNTLGGDYTESAIRERIDGKKTVKISENSTQVHVSLRVDIQAKIREGKGEGYRQWATIFNLKQAAKTLLFLQENGIDSYEDLKEKAASSSSDIAALNAQIKDVEKRQKGIADLQRQIGIYSKTRSVYSKYKESGWSRKFYDAHTGEIVAHRAAKAYFNAQGFKGTLPSITSLKQDWATLDSEKRSLYGAYHKRKNTTRELQVALANAQQLLGMERDIERQEKTRNEYTHYSMEK